MSYDSRTSFWRSGDPYIWLSGGMLGLTLVLLIGMFVLILVNGLGFFWPSSVAKVERSDGTAVYGEIKARERIPVPNSEAHLPDTFRIQLKRGNRDLYGSDFIWIDEADITAITYPANVAAFERLEWGNFYGTVSELDGQPLADQTDLAAVQDAVARETDVRAEIKSIEKYDVGYVSHEQTSLREELRGLEMQDITSGPRVDAINTRQEELLVEYEGIEESLVEKRQLLTSSVLAAAADGQTKVIEVAEIARVFLPNEMGVIDKSVFYLTKVWEFVSDNPRESNTEGGVYPAIFGTVMMVLIMSVVVTPLGVIAAIYLREYATQGRLVSIVRIAVNNLAGVPSIVFGVFGVGFFIYVVGGGIDNFFFAERLPTPTYGTGGILWASLTLALLTLPTVIVATEEGLAAIPRHQREASYALGATKFETTWRVILPALTPSILTGVILAVARAAGEVAPLMITGVVKLAPAMPVDGMFPYVHLDRKFMHLGFHIYDVGFQAPNVDAARPMVFTTTLLLLVLVVLLNLSAIRIRARLRKKFAVSAV